MNNKWILWLVAGYLLYDALQKKKIADAALTAQTDAKAATNKALEMAQNVLSTV